MKEKISYSKRRFIKRLGIVLLTSFFVFPVSGGELKHSPTEIAVWPENLVWAIQEKLNELGFDAGKADGLIGPDTRRAIRAFQKEKGMDADGEISTALLEALGFEQ